MSNSLTKLTLAIAALAVYYPILGNNFTFGWDDNWMVVNQYVEGGVNFANIWALLTERYHGQYAPVNQLLFLFLYTIFGYHPLPFHLTSLLLHIGCILWVYTIIRKLFALTPRIRYPYANEVAFFTALLFAVHPLNVESVAWISAVKVLNYSFFYLAATYSFLCFWKTRKIQYYIFALLLFILSCGGKEQAVIFPIWLLMLQWLLGSDLKCRKCWLEVAPFFFISLFFGVITMMAQPTGVGVIVEPSFPLWQRFLFACYSFVEYLVKFVFPYNLLYIYPFPITSGEPVPVWMLWYPGLILVTGVCLWKYIKKWYIACGLAFFFIHIALVLHIVPISRSAIVADRYIYMASIGLSFIVAYYFVLFLKSERKAIKRLSVILFAGIILCFGIRSNLRCRQWEDFETIKKDLRELLEQRPDYSPNKFDNDFKL
ncbi:MAG: hypothetical protein LBQ60_05405 [Bacteroidales bacterium]|jgi:hypothetical protein|nr:hypothetical protein [Bacteroidales bacterium]